MKPFKLIEKTNRTLRNCAPVDRVLLSQIHPREEVWVDVDEFPQWVTRTGHVVNPETGNHCDVLKVHFEGSRHEGSWAKWTYFIAEKKYCLLQAGSVAIEWKCEELQ